MRALDDGLVSAGTIDRATDVIDFPNLADNRVLSSVLRGASYTCNDSSDNYGDADFLLAHLVRAGRSAPGDAVCTSMVAVYGDLQRAMQDFARHR